MVQRWIATRHEIHIVQRWSPIVSRHRGLGCQGSPTTDPGIGKQCRNHWRPVISGKFLPTHHRQTDTIRGLPFDGYSSRQFHTSAIITYYRCRSTSHRYTAVHAPHQLLRAGKSRSHKPASRRDPVSRYLAEQRLHSGSRSSHRHHLSFCNLTPVVIGRP